jgi:ABC-2 type transport system ATP-binding protein
MSPNGEIAMNLDRDTAIGPPAVAAIIVDHVTKSFPGANGAIHWFRHFGKPPRRTVIHDVSLTVGCGELFALLGPNGAGKTTLLKMLATLTIPDSGSIWVDGVDTTRAPALAKQRIGLCTSEERSFYFRLTARGNLEFFGALAGLRGRALQRRIDEVVDMVDLGATLDRRFESYSSGMRQRLTVARALLADPDVLLLDEPTRAVDPIHAEAIRGLIRDELVGRQHKTVVLATNLLEEAWRLCDRVAVINDGRIVALGPPRRLDEQLNAVRSFVAVLDSVDDGLLSRTRAIRGFAGVAVAQAPDGVRLTVKLTSSERMLRDLMRVLTSNGATLRDFRPLETHPVDVFRSVVGARGGD